MTTTDSINRAEVNGDATTTVEPRLHFDHIATTFSRAMAHLDQAATTELDKVGFDPRLRELVRLRASQLNGCAYCVDTHSLDARSVGESDQRLYALPVWKESPFFTPRERAALEFTETVTMISDTHVPDDAYRRVSEQYRADEIAALLSLVVVINAWNALGVATRCWTPQPR